MARLLADCRRFPNESECSLVIIGEEGEVEQAALEHAISVHGYQDTQELREQVHRALEPAEDYAPRLRAHQTLPA